MMNEQQRRAVKKIFDVVMIAAIIAVGIFAFTFISRTILRHSNAVLALWLFVPAVSVWFATKSWSQELTDGSFTFYRRAFLGASCILSFAAFLLFDPVRDELGYRYIDGFSVNYYPDVDEFGRTTGGSSISTATFLGRAALWAFEWLYFITCLLAPLITSVAFSRMGEKRIRNESTR